MKVFPVIHVQSPIQAVEQACIADSCGADGVYLINHQGGFRREGLFEAFNQVHAALPGKYIGLNLLDGDPLQAYAAVNRAYNRKRLARLPDALWVDDARAIGGGIDNLKELERFRQHVPELATVRLLGGVAFKYTPTYTDSSKAAVHEVRELAQYVDVITTSGEGTGSPPSPKKIMAMKQAAPHKPLAIASGVDTANIGDYSQAADEILVASSVETEPYSGIFDQQALLELLVKAKSM